MKLSGSEEPPLQSVPVSPSAKPFTRYEDEQLLSLAATHKRAKSISWEQLVRAWAAHYRTVLHGVMNDTFVLRSETGLKSRHQVLTDGEKMKAKKEPKPSKSTGRQPSSADSTVSPSSPSVTMADDADISSAVEPAHTVESVPTHESWLGKVVAERNKRERKAAAAQESSRSKRRLTDEGTEEMKDGRGKKRK